MPPKRSARIEAKNKKKMKEAIEESSSAAVSQQRLTMPVNILPVQARVDAKNKRKMKEVMEEPSSAAMNFFPVQPHQQQLHPFNSQQKKQCPAVPDNLDKFLTKPFTTFTALLTEEDDDFVPAPIKRMYDHIDQVTAYYSGQVKNMLLDVYMRHFNSLASVANKEAGKKLEEKEEELRQAKMKIMELQLKVNQLIYQLRNMQTKVTNLEGRCAVLDARLYAAAQSDAQQKQESVESSHVDRHVVEPLLSIATCQACFKAKAAATIWPCRHFCVCVPCAAAVTACPICQTPKFTGP